MAPKPAWFRQSLRKIRDEQDQKKGFSRSFGARSGSPAANLSIKQKIHSFETFSNSEAPENGGHRRPGATSLTVMESKGPHASHDTASNQSAVACAPTKDDPPTDLTPHLDSGPDDFQSTPVCEREAALSSKQGPERESVEVNRSAEPREPVPVATSCGDEDHDGKLLSISDDSSCLRGLEAESIGRILTFSNQVGSARPRTN